MSISVAEDLILSRTFEADILAPLSELMSQLGIVSELTYCEPTSNSAIRLDLDGPFHVGRITLWQDGSYESEALRVADAVTVHSFHAHVSEIADISNAVRALASIVASHSQQNAI